MEILSLENFDLLSKLFCIKRKAVTPSSLERDFAFMHTSHSQLLSFCSHHLQKSLRKSEPQVAEQREESWGVYCPPLVTGHQLWVCSAHKSFGALHSVGKGKKYPDYSLLYCNVRAGSAEELICCASELLALVDCHAQVNS